MKCLEKGFGAVRIEAFVSGREQKMRLWRVAKKHFHAVKWNP